MKNEIYKLKIRAKQAQQDLIGDYKKELYKIK